MQGFNRVFLMGRLGAEPEIKESRKGEFYTRLSIANNYLDSEKTSHTDWYSVMVWGSQAQNAARFLSKGSGVMVEAYLDNYTRETETGGTEKILGLKAKSVQFLPRPKSTLDAD